MANKEIKFIDSKYNELFSISDGDSICIKYADGDIHEKVCKYLDNYHTSIDGVCYHICQWAEMMERCGHTFEPAYKVNNLQLVKKNYDKLDKDKFFKTAIGYTEVYYNPDAESGGQLVYNEISEALIKEANQYSKNIDGFFSYIDSSCTQYLIDIDTPEFCVNLESFMNRKADLEGCTKETMNTLKEVAGIESKTKDMER